MARVILQLPRAAKKFAEGHKCSKKENADPSPRKGFGITTKRQWQPTTFYPQTVKLGAGRITPGM
jgi:hypothetical protein